MVIDSTTKWVIKDAEEKQITQLQKQLKIHPVICKLLVQRGIYTFDQAKKFFRPSLRELHNPFLMQDMDIAIQRINNAIYYKEKILIYGDYDVDGTTAVATVYSYFKKIYDDVHFYIPNRYKEGYGVSTIAIDWAKENDFSLIICLDCGIKAIDKIAYAKEIGIDFIIGDHHTPGEELPPAVAVLDPKREDCNYPFTELSGCGIGFKIVQAYNMFHRKDASHVFDLLDLVVVSIASDIVPIVNENRVLAHYGLEKLNNNPSQGLKSIMELSGIKNTLSISDIVFVIGPRINAAGRMDDATQAVKLLVAIQNERANDKAAILQKHNTDRRVIDTDITQEAVDMIIENAEQLAKKTTVLYQPHWHKGVIGIVASRLMQRFYRPTVILTLSNGKVTGSARSVNGFNVYEAIKECDEYIEQFGGHMYAAGLTMEEKYVDAFIKKFEKVVGDTITDDQLIPEISIDAEIRFKDINEKFFNIIQQIAPFGPHNMRPVFMAKNIFDTGYSSIVGENHLKLNAKQSDSFAIKGIGYGMADKYDLIKEGQAFDLCFTIEENTYRGNSSLQLNIKDLKPSES